MSDTAPTAPPNGNGKSRDSIIDRIRKLRRMTETNGASEAEALMAAAQIAKLVAQYDIGESELRLKADAIGMVDDSYSMPGTFSSFHSLVAKAIASLTHTKLRIREVVEDPFDLGMPMPWIYVKFYGYPLDCEAAIALSAICQTSIITESERWEKANPLPKGKTKKLERERSILKESFHYGICERLAERIRSFMEQEGPKTGALVSLKGQLVDQHYAEFLRDKGLGLRTRVEQDIALNGEAYTAGRLSANNIDLGRSERLQTPAS